MNFVELFILAVGLSMDAFAIAICIGLTMVKFNIKKALIVGAYFGISQAVMPLAGYFLASLFAERVILYGDWIAFIVLSFIGGKMIIDSLKKDDESDTGEKPLKLAVMLPLAIATSIDALAVGVSFAFLQINIVFAAILIGITTFTISMAGIKIGNMFGAKFKSKAQLAGGIMLVLIGLKIILEHFEIISY